MSVVYILGLLLLFPMAAIGASCRHAVYGQPDTPLHIYYRDAAYNLSQWRSSLFQQTIKFQTMMTKNRVLKNITSVDRVSQTLEERKFNMLEPVVTCPAGSKLESVGTPGQDGSKWLCGPSSFKAPCVIYSMGSRGDYTFEEAMLALTQCHIHTFDCTFANGKSIHPRHFFHKLCISGNPKETLPNFKTYGEITRMLDHTEIALLKMDIEGYEFDVLSGFSESDKYLPNQIALEIHLDDLYWGTPAHLNANDFSNLFWPQHVLSMSDMSLFLFHLANLGYALVNKEDNPNGTCCFEVTLVKVESLVCGHMHSPAARALLGMKGL